ncbi:hypothetical protein [Mycobacteroides abscessus]|uniref:hypothetical protein n=1 Tax=Mycobacteroides abscessus TaxID=36809 RepID=UPI0009CD7DF1|nr:hypothetical protein [Mycobacteroides abscessus]MBL3752866.1 hypothetical protein [Mycobacteroides abscessus subsp. massiliense]SLI43003.1 Uncharacterised protein [Mycobacteroides abscessus subsp. abscessus]
MVTTHPGSTADCWAVDGIVLGQKGFPALLIPADAVPQDLAAKLLWKNSQEIAGPIPIPDVAPYVIGFASEQWNIPILCKFADENQDLLAETFQLDGQATAFTLVELPSSEWIARLYENSTIVLCAYTDIFIASHLAESATPTAGGERFLSGTGFAIARVLALNSGPSLTLTWA